MIEFWIQILPIVIWLYIGALIIAVTLDDAKYEPLYMTLYRLGLYLIIPTVYYSVVDYYIH